MKRTSRISKGGSCRQNTQYQIDKQREGQLLATRPPVSKGEAVALCCYHYSNREIIAGRVAISGMFCVWQTVKRIFRFKDVEWD